MRLIYCRLVVHTPCLKSNIDPSTDISSMTCAASPEVDKGLSVWSITLSMANRDLQEELCVFGALTPYAMASTAFLMVKGGMMPFPPCLPVGQRHWKQWFMTLCVPLNCIAWHKSQIFCQHAVCHQLISHQRAYQVCTHCLSFNVCQCGSTTCMH